MKINLANSAPSLGPLDQVEAFPTFVNFHDVWYGTTLLDGWDGITLLVIVIGLLDYHQP